ncbi:Rlim, partial [Symbiodinium pilosum]
DEETVLVDEEEPDSTAGGRSTPRRRRRRSAGGEDMQIARLLQLEEVAQAGVLPPELLGALPRPCLAGRWRESPMDRALLAAASTGGALAEAVAQSVDRQSARAHSGCRFVVTLAGSTMLCRGCHSDILPGCLMILCKRDLSHRTHPAHPACLALIRGLTRRPSRGHGDVQFDAGLHPAARSSALAAIEQLPADGGSSYPGPHHLSPPAFPDAAFLEAAAFSEEAARHARPTGRRGPRHRLQSELQARLQQGGDFTAEDYELLLQLDETSTSRADRDEEQCLQKSLIAALPLSKVAAGSTIAQCMICLENMEVGAKIRTLPCMHVFHRKCIDRWLSEPGRKPRCPIDQAEVQLAPA